MKWNDENRFSQDGYSKATVFPKVENYKNYEYFLEDLAKASARENNHREWVLEEMSNYSEETEIRICLRHSEDV